MKNHENEAIEQLRDYVVEVAEKFNYVTQVYDISEVDILPFKGGKPIAEFAIDFLNGGLIDFENIPETEVILHFSSKEFEREMFNYLKQRLLEHQSYYIQYVKNLELANINVGENLPDYGEKLAQRIKKISTNPTNL